MALPERSAVENIALAVDDDVADRAHAEVWGEHVGVGQPRRIAGGGQVHVCAARGRKVDLPGNVMRHLTIILSAECASESAVGQLGPSEREEERGSLMSELVDPQSAVEAEGARGIARVEAREP